MDTGNRSGCRILVGDISNSSKERMNIFQGMSIGESIAIGLEIIIGFIIVVGVAIIQSKMRKEEWEEENNSKKI